MIKDGPAFVGDASIVPAMDKFCSQRNQVVHEDVEDVMVYCTI